MLRIFNQWGEFMKKAIWFLLVGLLLVSFVSALDIEKEAEKIKTIFNDNIDQVPGIVIALFGNEQINVYVSDVKEISQESDVIIGVSMQEGLIESVKEGELEKPTMNAYLTEETLLDLLWSTDPFNDFSAALDEGKITYKAVTFTGKIKYGIAGVVGTVIGWFT